MRDDSRKIENIELISDEMVQIEYRTVDQCEEMSLNTNPVIASFCTCWARLKPLGVMNDLGSRVLYHDTDSIIYTLKEGEYSPPIGNYLGELTNELTCKEIGCVNDKCHGHWIEEFVSCGPKNYAYKLNTGEVTCKVRGFSLNYSASHLLNFNSMKETLFQWMESGQKECVETIIVGVLFKRYKGKGIVRSVEVPKRYSIVYNKRQVLPDYTTIPFGY